MRVRVSVFRGCACGCDIQRVGGCVYITRARGLEGLQGLFRGFRVVVLVPVLRGLFSLFRAWFCRFSAGAGLPGLVLVMVRIGGAGAGQEAEKKTEAARVRGRSPFRYSVLRFPSPYGQDEDQGGGYDNTIHCFRRSFLSPRKSA